MIHEPEKRLRQMSLEDIEFFIVHYKKMLQETFLAPNSRKLVAWQVRRLEKEQSRRGGTKKAGSLHFDEQLKEAARQMSSV